MLSKTELSDNEGEDSHNILPILLGKNQTQQKPARIFHSGSGIFAIRQDQWKLIQGTKGSGSGRIDLDNNSLNSIGQLYDLENDPSEQNDLWGVQPDITKRLMDLLERYKRQGFSRETTK